MAEAGDRRSATATTAPRRRSPGLRRAWCCSFSGVPQSPDLRISNYSHHAHVLQHNSNIPLRNSKLPPKSSYAASFHSSPSPSSKLGLGIIDPRRILSPGRVSPIDSDVPLGPTPAIVDDAASVTTVAAESEPECPDPAVKERSVVPERKEVETGVRLGERGLDLTLSLKGKDGRCLMLELESRVLCESSGFFAAMVSDMGRKHSDASSDCHKIEVAGVEDMDVFKDTIELMYEQDQARWLMKTGVSRAIDILEVSSTIMFEQGVRSCLKYIEAVPWSEDEEEKLKSLFSRLTFPEAISEDVLVRLGPPQTCSNSEDLALQLIKSVTNGVIGNARKELQFLVNGLLSKSSVYHKDPAGLNKGSLYQICYSSLDSLVDLFEEASDAVPENLIVPTRGTKPLIERISKQVENLNWLLDILLNQEMAEDFVDLWANQEGLVRMHERASPMVRYELSRISASIFIALGRRKLHCRSERRIAVIHSWFRPTLVDFGWLQRCSKGLDIRMLEDSLGQVLLTIPLNQQHILFEEWFRCFSAHGTECPNLGKAFQVWWRRTFGRSSEMLR